MVSQSAFKEVSENTNLIRLIHMNDKFYTPASHENSLVCTELLSVNQDGDICKNIPATQTVQVEQHITCMACELYAAVRCASHFVKIWEKNE